MPFDGIVLAAVAAQLSAAVAGGRIEKIYQPERDEIVLHIGARGGKHRLLVSSNGSNPRICLTEDAGPYPQNPYGFCMLLRKHIQNGRISGVEQPGSERVIVFSIETANELGFSQSKRLIVEIMGKHSNIILVDPETGRIIDSIKRLSAETNRYRQTLPGCAYIEPPSHGKIPWGEADADAIGAMAASCLGPGLAQGPDGLLECVSGALLSGIQGLSPRAAAELAGQALGGGPDPPDDVAGALYAALSGLRARIGTGDFSPRVYLDGDGRPVDFHAFPISALEGPCRPLGFGDISAAADYYYANRDSSSRVRQKAAELAKAARSGLDRLLLKRQRVSEELEKAGRAEEYRLAGELLTASLHALEPGRSAVTLTNYYDGSPMAIELDPRLTPSQNAQRYYRLYRKAKTAAAEKVTQLAAIDRDAAYLESVLAFIENASTVEDADALRQELTESGYLRRRKAPGGKKRPAPGPAPLSYALYGGFQALVGRNNTENDFITFRKASPRDLWLHTKDLPGAHVVMLTEGREPPERAILEAASLAAWHSKGRASENVPVDYCLARHVKKPSGAKPGMVIFTNNRTVYASPVLPPDRA
ncbi:MAG: NFACT family protein [Clostridiales Family XIII bacterium]|jgi:predicted ribosome quality control (RQC) complex YloA/Tae2 family protein|nr:NFACT family protein [Clostridiales Family XIII bacterium]